MVSGWSLFSFQVSFADFIHFSLFEANRFLTSEQNCLNVFIFIFISLYLCFFLSVISFPSLPSERIQTLPQCINKCWEIAMLFFAKYISIASARPRVCSKAADTGFPLSHKKKCVILSLPQSDFYPPRHSVAANP